ncbi:DinB family protein [Deinococcus sp. Arct2-2]|uniref:DinB family protein n=1 Tax=Deinococcus sp. Arct2-2 TaxID=2568653 RepID=UPI0010A42F3A|nr:DinB family protein [Deinococcus sp. Arct2-2]THF68291.1 DinB family protein [Deinococcus sp. Arct2-2]
MTLTDLVAHTLPRLQALTDAQASAKAAPDVWSAKEVLGHLIDSGVNNHARFVRASVRDGLELPGYAQNDWVAAGAYGARAWADLVSLWAAYQLQLAHIIAHLPPPALARTVRVGGGEAVTLGFLAEDYVAHQMHHLNQIWERTGA